MNEYTGLAPQFHLQLLNDISSIESPSPILPLSIIQSLPNTQWKENPDLVKQGLSYLHAIGAIVLFGEDKFCNRLEKLSHLLAKFTSPNNVRNELLLAEDEQVNILTSPLISQILEIRFLNIIYMQCFILIFKQGQLYCWGVGIDEKFWCLLGADNEIVATRSK